MFEMQEYFYETLKISHREFHCKKNLYNGIFYTTSFQINTTKGENEIGLLDL